MLEMRTGEVLSIPTEKGDKMKFPKVLYVRFESDDTEGYFLASKNPNGEHNDEIAVYEFKEVKTLVIKEELA